MELIILKIFFDFEKYCFGDSVKVLQTAGNTPERFEILARVSHYEILKLLEEAWKMRTGPNFTKIQN